MTLAVELDGTERLTNYGKRRNYLASWIIPSEDWSRLHGGLPDGHRNPVPSDRSRIFDSIIVWTHITKGEYTLAPLLHYKSTAPADSSLRAYVYAKWHRRKRRAATRHQVELATRLYAYADQLAAEIDIRAHPQ
ncbi:hypothetical protein [Kitasatospora sp. NPDC005751]|uniref:hypothetical protein n=1 Tax=Kitasatospora sp. NPDC005751 TaxID=3157064 RepID=UPI0033D844E9